MKFKDWYEGRLDESGFARVRRMLFGDVPNIKSIAIFTAQNPGGKQSSSEENKKRNKELWNDLRLASYGPIRVKGKYTGKEDLDDIKSTPEEDSFIIPNISRNSAIAYGKRYDQEVVIWGEKYTDENKNPFFRFEYIDKGITLSVRTIHMSGEDVQERPDYYTRIGNRKFVIPFLDDPLRYKVPGNKYGTVVDAPANNTSDNIKQAETFYIPFFDNPEAYELEFSGELIEPSFYAQKFYNNPYAQELIGEIHTREEKLQEEGYTSKYYWQQRGTIIMCLEKLGKL
jgi:hypothetical protein